MSMIPRNLPSQAERDARRNAEYLAAYGERCPEHVARALLALYENTNSMGAHPEVGKLKSRYTRVGGDTVLRQARYWIRNTMRGARLRERRADHRGAERPGARRAAPAGRSVRRQEEGGLDAGLR